MRGVLKLNFFLSVFCLFFLFFLKIGNNFSNLSFFLFLLIDKISFFFCSLLLILTLLGLISAIKIYNLKFFFIFILMLKSCVFFSFLTGNFLSFFMFFELSMIPIVFLILGWGLQPERLMASSYLFLYTLFGSLPLLMNILILMSNFSSSNFFLLQYFILCSSFTAWWYMKSSLYMYFFFWLFAFLVKLPLFGFHFWLPKAHVEAPTLGSMILAGLLLKLGSFGLLRLESLMNFSKMYFNKILFLWVICSCLVLNLICMNLHDLKMIVAYSSMIHMGLLVLGLFKYKTFSSFSMMSISLAHGFMSSAMFLYVGSVYHLSSTRSMLFKNSFSLFSGFFMFNWFICCCLNMTFPFTLPFFGELFLFSVCYFWWGFSLFFLLFNILLMGLFNMYLYSLLSHGKSYNFLQHLNFNLFKLFGGFIHVGFLLLIVFSLGML